jgi:trimethylamine--corrinoid protein Co-methyltransferase
MDEEISAMSKRIATGINVTEDTIACDLIKQLGQRGDYLTADHTLKWLRSEEYLPPRVSVRGPYAVWQAAGAKDTYMLAKEKVQQLGRGAGGPIEANRAAKLNEIIGSFRE